MNAIPVPRNQKFFWKVILSGFAVELEQLAVGSKSPFRHRNFGSEAKAVGTLNLQSDRSLPRSHPIALAFTPTADR
jgi:hypothetical protein